MAFTTRIPTHVIDLQAPAELRWKPAVKGRKRLLRRLLRKALVATDDALGDWRILRGGAARGLGAAYAVSGGLYRDELAFFGAAANVPARDVLWANCGYELSAFVENVAPGCTSGIVDTADGPCLVRAMDWCLDGLLGDASCWLEFEDEGRDFVVLGVPGLVGALQGMVPGEWAVALNYAPASERPGFDFGPVFLLRHALETCDTYGEAVELLRDSRLSAPAFFVVAGAKTGQGCIIERTRRDASVRRLKDGVATVANHHVVRRLRSRNRWAADLDWSEHRRDELDDRLRELPSGSSLRQILRCTMGSPITWEATEQRVAFRPRTGERIASVRCV